MRILIVTDIWQTHDHGVGHLLVELTRELQQIGHSVTVVQPGAFACLPLGAGAPRWVAWPGERLRRLMDEARPDAVHIATQGPLGWAARRHCLRRRWPFSSACHSDVAAWLGRRGIMPPPWADVLMQRFHRESSAVLVSSPALLRRLESMRWERLHDWSPGVDTRLFRLADPPLADRGLGPLARPVSLYVGPVTHERDVEAFLELDVPGSKLVCGDGPQARALSQRHPNVHWLGVLPRHDLVRIYQAADVLVYPGRQDGAGRVVLEAMACGTPVAARPVDGPLQRVADQGGALDHDLSAAWHAALRQPRWQVHAHASAFAWPRAAAEFVQLLPSIPVNRRSRAVATSVHSMASR
ncbi:glycosyltransferase [uncultured Hydrogenophaga sp.]|uniref:glycosyltransferase n=1 Tax=uncultured Hydrogenophaga sp. TaxID=199683 RepID=UPI0026603489|nr:glycosyltransferase [uncultured Hydrogenophaga sp.]